MIITTSGRPDENLIKSAIEIANEFDSIFLRRNKKAVDHLKRENDDDILVVGKNRMELHFSDSTEPLFFHPNSAMFRIKRIIKGEDDPFCLACKLEKGNSFLDCTLGLASDSIIASYVVGDKGIVTGIEGSKPLAFLVQEGLLQWETGLPQLDDAMKRIHVKNTEHLAFLKECPDNSFDVIYFDPMFEETIEGSVGLQPLKRIANYSTLTKETLFEAKRVASKRVVLKDHWRSSRFAEFQFQVNVRKTAKFHYGVIDLNK